MRRFSLSGSFRKSHLLLIAFVAFSACTDRAPTGLSPSAAALARSAGGNGPTVKSTDPDSATIDTTLNVRVFGSGYDQGSRADWAFKGVVSDKIVTNSTVFLSSTELVANITIARNANIGSHDVIVTTSAGKGGIGTELFVVTMKMTQLPSLGGFNAEAYAINDAGHAVGWSTDSIGYGYAVRWTNEGGVWMVRKIGPQATVEMSQALAINEHGTAVGFSEGRTNAAVWRIDGSKTTIGRGWASAINNSDVIVGSIGATDNPPTNARPAVWTPAGSSWTIRRVLERPTGMTQANCGLEEALGISDDNVIVGFVYDGACTQIPVQWRPTADGSDWLPAEPLSPSGTLAKGVAQAILGSTIVGSAYPCAVLNGCVRKAFRWTLGGSSGPIGTLDARANGLNRAGYIAGSYIRKGGQMTGLVWSPVTSTFVFLSSPGGTGDNWAWDVNDGSPRRAVGAARINSGGRVALVWTIP
jgi:hypothetical protein